MDIPENSRHYTIIEEAMEFLAQRRQEQPSLGDLSGHIGLSEFYLQRLFSDWAGISPKRFLQFLNKEYIKTRLEQSRGLLNVAFEAGLSSPSRLHDLFIETESISPAQYRSMGKNLVIHYGFHESPFGSCLIAVTDRGICHLAFIWPDRETVLGAFKEDWCHATLLEDRECTASWHEKIFASPMIADRPLHLLLKGTNFQIKVWEALLNLPTGELCDYTAVAMGIGSPSATRAAASAIARNRIAYLIPCHRVVRKIGETGEYRWGKSRKKIMLAWEASQIISDKQAADRV